jgi:phosphate uptake regulator
MTGGSTASELDEGAARRVLEARLIAMGNVVDSLFADSVMAVLERSPGMAGLLRKHDYRAHEQWMEVDRLCVDLLSSGPRDAAEIRFIASALNIAGALKRMGDESLRIGEALRSRDAGQDDPPAAPEPVLRLIEAVQGMLGDVLAALANRDGAAAPGLHAAFREVAGLCAGAVGEAGAGVQRGELPPAFGTALISVAQRLERIGDEILEVANQVNHLYRPPDEG